MIYPPIFQVCSVDPAVTAWLGESPCRLYLFGLAPQSHETPYAVWQVISGLPENYLAGRPDADSFTLQVDVYARTASESRSVAQVLMYAIELHAHVVGYRGEERDTETGLYRSGFDVDWIVSRAQVEALRAGTQLERSGDTSINSGQTQS